MILTKWKDRQKNTIKLHLDKVKQHKYMAETSRKASECYCIKKSTMYLSVETEYSRDN